MLQRVLVFGLLGPLALVGGCASRVTGRSNSSDVPAATKPAEQLEADKAAGTKRIALSVSGMT